MNNSDMPANPTESISNNGAPYYKALPSNGLTKREAFAMAAMQGMLVKFKDQIVSTDDIALCSVQQADSLLKQLEE